MLNDIIYQWYIIIIIRLLLVYWFTFHWNPLALYPKLLVLKVPVCEAYTLNCLWPASDSISMYTVCLILGSLFAACYAVVCHFHHMLAIWLHSCVPVFLPVQGMMTNIWPHTVSPLTIDNIMWQLWFHCSCAGTHVAGHIDSVSRLKELCDQHNMWLHLQGYGAVGDCRL